MLLIRSLKKTVSVKIKFFSNRERESSLELYLAQGISRGEKMDFTIQKAVELGVKKIYPLLTERCNVKLDAERSAKRLLHWQLIITNACEQSGRNWIPEIMAPQSLASFLHTVTADHKFVLAPHAKIPLTDYPLNSHDRVVLLIGSEGGLSEEEILQAQQQQFFPLNLGPRILRTETAAVAALTALQFYAGDLGFKK